MKLIERYIFARMLRAWLLALATLTVTVWLTQALRQVDLVTAKGQTFWLFLKISLFVLPEVATVIAPIALLIAVTYTFTTLNTDSELVVINASGAPQMTLLRPVMAISLIAAAVIAAMTVYFTPLSQRLWRVEITDVRASVITSIVSEGRFMKIADGLVFHLRDRRADGTLHGIFVSDTRDPNSTVTYLAEFGTILQNPIGTFIIMTDGTIQRSNRSGGISMIEFTSYAFDLSTFASQSEAPAYRPADQPTSYLFNPDPEDRYYQRSPGQFAAELHRRLSAPFHAFVFALVPLVLLVQAESTRRRHATTLTAGVLAAALVWVAGSFFASAADSLVSAILAYAVPIGASIVAIVLILTGKRPKLPERLTELVDISMERAGAYFSRSTRAGKPGW